MRYAFQHRTFALAAVVLLAASSCGQGATERGQAIGSERSAVTETEVGSTQAHLAANVIQDAVMAKDAGIPEALLQRAWGIAVVPNVVKAAFGLGGQWGKGLVTRRLENGEWSAPIHISMGGVSYGLQIGASSTDLVLVFTDPKGLEAMLDDGLKLGAEAAVAAGPIGRDAQLGTNLTLDTAIYSYSRSEGLFAGVSLAGAVITVDESSNSESYGAQGDAEQVLAGKVGTPELLKPFTQAVGRFVPPMKRS